MLKLHVVLINILYFVQIINCDQIIINDEVVAISESDQSDAFDFESVQLFDKLKQLEITTLENIKKLNLSSNEQMIAISKINENYNLEFNKETETLQNLVKPKLHKRFDLENCSSKTVKEFDVIYIDEKSFPNILMMESQQQQDKIITNYTRKIEDFIKNGIEEHQMSFLTTESMNKTELTNFSQSFENFLAEINQKVNDEYNTASLEIMNTTSSYQKSLGEKLAIMKDRMKILIENFKICTKHSDLDK